MRNAVNLARGLKMGDEGALPMPAPSLGIPLEATGQLFDIHSKSSFWLFLLPRRM